MNITTVSFIRSWIN